MKSGRNFFFNTIQEKNFLTVLLILGVVGSILIVSLLNTFIYYQLTEDEFSQGVEVTNIKPHFSITESNPINIDGNGL